MKSIQQQIQNSTSFFFIIAVAVLSIVSVFGVWKFIASDAIAKSFETFMLATVVSFVVIVASYFVGKRAQSGASAPAYEPNPIFHGLRQVTLAGLIALAALLAFLGVLSIWDVIQDGDVLWKALSSLGIFCFGAFIIVLVCLEREALPQPKEGGVHSDAEPTKMVTLIIGLFFLSLFLSSLAGFNW